MRGEMLIVEDLLMLLLDDKTGSPAAAGTLYYTLGGALLVDLALRGRVETDGSGGPLSGPKVVTAGEGPLPDPMLQDAYDKVAEKPQRVQPLLIALGNGLWKPVTERLIDRGLIRREKKRFLGIIPVTHLPVQDAGPETELRGRIRAVLEDGAEPDPRTAAITALLSASGALPALRPRIAWSGEVYKRAKALEKGDWGAEAVNTAVTRTAAAVAAAAAAAAVAHTAANA